MGLTIEHSKLTHASGIIIIYTKMVTCLFLPYGGHYTKFKHKETIWGKVCCFCFRLFIFGAIIGLS